MKKLLAMVLAATMLLACAGSALAEKTTVELWTLFTGDDGAILQGIVDVFNASQDEVEINHIAIDRETLYTKLALAVQSGEGIPDFFVTYTYDIPYFTTQEMIQPIEEVLAAAEGFDFALDKYHPAAALANVYGGSRYAVSLDFPTWGMYVNTALAQQYCPDQIADKILTFEEIKEIGEALKAQNVEDMAVVVSGWARNDQVNTYMELTASWATEDGKELAIDRDAAIKTINLWKELYDAGYLWQEGDDTMGRFALGESIFLTGGTWNMSAIDTYGFDYEFIPAVQVSPDHVVVFGASHAFMMPVQEYTDAEKKAMDAFMAYFYENSIDWAKAGSIVASNATLSSDAYQAMPQAYISNNYDTQDRPYTYTSIVMDVLFGLDWQPVYGQMTAEDFADTWMKQVQERIAAQ